MGVSGDASGQSRDAILDMVRSDFLDAPCSEEKRAFGVWEGLDFIDTEARPGGEKTERWKWGF